MPRNVAVLIGSLRQDGYSRKVFTTLQALAPPSLAFAVLETGDLPLYNQDLEQSPPAAWERFRAELGQADAILIVTPEYNRSIPGALKNAIDIASRPMAAKRLDGKPVGIVSLSMGRLGGVFANQHLRPVLAVLGAHVMPAPEVYFGAVHEAFETTGALKDGPSRDLLKSFAEGFADYVETFAK